MNDDVLDYLKVCHEHINSIPIEIRKEVAFVGDSSEDWFKSVDVNWKPNKLNSGKLNRNDLINKRNQLKSQGDITFIDIRTFIIDILAWGAKRFYKQETMSTIESFENICRSLLEDKISPEKAYEEFYDRHHSGQMLGLGPAYYTKLICFFGDQKGLIMDQWTVRSVNKLKNKTIVKMLKQNGQEYVHNKNTDSNYAEFLSVVSEIKEKLNLSSVLDAEELIFSSSHKKNLFKKTLSNKDYQILSAWRKYIAEDIKINFDTFV